MPMKNIIGGNGDQRGSNSYNVFEKLFGKSHYQYHNAGHFDSLVQKLILGEYDKIIIPVHNNLIGDVEPVHEALAKFVTNKVKLYEENEYKCLINHALIGGPDSSLEELTKIYGYPVATNQCRDAMKRLNKEEVFHPDTYGAVVDVVKRNLPNEAAVGPYEAAQKEGGKILIENLSDNKDNITTFKVYSLDL